jgi:hypothetical protein
MVGGDGPLQLGKGDPRPTPVVQDQREGIPLARLGLDAGLGQLKLGGVQGVGGRTVSALSGECPPRSAHRSVSNTPSSNRT